MGLLERLGLDASMTKGAPAGAPAHEAKQPGQASSKHSPDGADKAAPVLQARTLHMPIRVPPSYDALRASIVGQLAREVMSRTPVPQPGGGEAPIHRERELVDTSNLRQLFGMLHAGEALELTARLVPDSDGHRYERIVFSLPHGHVVQGEEIDINGEVGTRGVGGPAFERTPPVPQDKLALARRILEQQLHAVVGADAPLMWTPTATGISRMMPALPGATSFGPGGDAVPQHAAQTSPRWNVMPDARTSGARVLGTMLQSRFGRDWMLGGDLNEAAIREVVNQFIAEARDARVMRNDRYNRLTAGAGQWGGGAMVDRDLRLYTAAELRLFEGDPTCLWRYVH